MAKTPMMRIFCFMHGMIEGKIKGNNVFCLKCFPEPSFEEWFPDLEKWVEKKFKEVIKSSAE